MLRAVLKAVMLDSPRDAGQARTGGTTIILRRCGPHARTIAPICRRSPTGPARARIVVCQNSIDRHHDKEVNPMTATGDLPDHDIDRPAPRDEIPNPETGVGIGARSEPDTFEPEEDPE